MTSAQVSPNGHRASPPPFSAENPAELNSADLPANQDNLNNTLKSADPIRIGVPSDEPERGISPEASDCQVEPRNVHISDLPSPDRAPAPSASAYHVPPKRFAPRPNAYAYDDSFHRPPETEPLPDRCQFMFSDGRQCTMARSDIHPSLCFYHADREEQLFGDPSYRCETRKLDFPELFSACRDLSTAAGVNRALAHVFRLLAQRRISRQEAATFGHLAKLLLRTISLMAAESTIQSEEVLRDLLTPEESLSDNVHTRVPSKGVIPKTSSPLSAPTFADRAESGRAGEAGSPARAGFARAGVQEDEESRAGSPTHAASACVGVQSVASICNSPEISTYENTRLNPIQNQHLHKHMANEASAEAPSGAKQISPGRKPWEAECATMKPR